VIPAAFDYVRAGSAGEAVSLIAEHGEDAKFLAGGMSLLPLMKLRLATPSVLVDVGRVRDLSYVRDAGDHVAIGALTRHRDEIGARPPAGDEACAANRPPGDCRIELLPVPCGLPQDRIESDSEHGEQDMHDQGREYAAGDGRGIMQSAEDVGVHRSIQTFAAAVRPPPHHSRSPIVV